MGHHRQSVDTTPCTQICRDSSESFQPRSPRSQQRDVQTVRDKMLGCGDLASGSSPSVCEHGLEEQRVACSCQSRFCLSCCKVSIAHWVAHSGQTLYAGVSSRQVVLTVPQALHRFCHRDRSRLAALRPCGVALFQDPLAWVTRGVLDVGSVVVLETAGRAGHWHPHRPRLMTSGGVTPAQRGREVDSVPGAVRPKTWPYSLCTMLKERVKTQAMRQLLDARWRQSPRGRVA